MELAEPLLGRVVGKHLHEWVELFMTLRERSRLGGSFYPWFREFWVPIVDLMLVSSTFHDIVSRLVRIAFGIQVPAVQEGINERLGFTRHSSKTHLITPTCQSRPPGVQ